MFRHLMLKKNQSLLQNIYLALQLLYHKRNSLIATVVDVAFYILREKVVHSRNHNEHQNTVSIKKAYKKLSNFYCIKNDFAKCFAKCCNLLFAHYGTSSKQCISMLQEKSNILMVHNFTKCFSGTTTNQRVNNVWMVICIVFAICYFQLRKKYLQNLLNKEMDNAGNHQFECY